MLSDITSTKQCFGDGWFFIEWDYQAIRFSKQIMSAACRRAFAVCPEFVDSMEDDHSSSSSSSSSVSSSSIAMPSSLTSSLPSPTGVFSTTWWLQLTHVERSALLRSYRGLLVNLFAVVIPARKKAVVFDKCDAARRYFIISVAPPRIDGGAFPSDEDDRALFMAFFCP